MSGSRAGYGTTDVDMGNGDVITLRPTLKAFQQLVRRWPNGIPEALDAVHALKVEDTAFILSVGSGANKAESLDMNDKVFHAGVALVAPQVVPYLASLLNPTGRDLSDNEPADGGDGEPDPGE